MKIYLTRAFVAVAGLASVVAVSACSSVGDVSDPITRKLTWFSFLSGDDLKPQCRVNEDRLRLVHNADYEKDMRVVEVAFDQNGAADVQEQLFFAIDWSDITINRDAWRGPWAPEIHSASWGKAEANKVLEALEADNAFTPLAKDVPIDSRDFFWVATGCHGGNWFFKAWAYPSDEYKALSFPNVVAGHLASEKPFAVAQPRDDAYPPDEKDEMPFFTTAASANGVKGRMQLPQPPFKTFLP